jgi:RNA polymerase sigma factor (sigma-70 family)
MDDATEWSAETRISVLLGIRAEATDREAAWQKFHSRYAPIIAGFARKMGVRTDDVADLVQEVMLGFYAASPQFQYDPARGRFRGYLKTCTWRVFKKRFASKLLIAGRPIEQLADDEPRVDEVWNDLWEVDLLRRATEIVRRKYELRPDGVRTFRAFELSVLLAQGSDEIAKTLLMSPASVYQARSRVGKAIKATMIELGAWDD